MTCTIGADRVIMVVPIHVLPIQVVRYTMVWTPPYWPIVPIERRMPAYPRRTPEPVINHRTIDIHRLNDIICTIYIFISYHLHCHSLRLGVFLHEYRSHILINILCQYGLNHYQVAVLVCGFNHTQVVHIAIAIQVEVRERRIRVIEHLLELLQVFGLSEQCGYGLQIQVLRYICIRSSNRYCLIRQSSHQLSADN